MSKQKKESSGAKQQGVTRRGFLKGAGLTAAGAAIMDAGLIGIREAAAAESSGPAVLGPERVPITLHVNGAAYKVSVEPRTTLAEALRFDLDKTGTKVVCDRGSCSACTVWVDSVPVCSCMTFALDVGDRQTTTIEGL